MADPTIKTWGPLKLTKTLIDTNDSSLTATDKEATFKLTTIDCFPGPIATTEYIKPQRFVPTVNPSSLQQSDKTNLSNLKNLFGGKPSTLNGIQTAIETKLDLDAMTVSYTSKAYKQLRKLYPCFTNELYLRVKFAVYEIKVSAARPVTLGSDTFPAGDEIATYRLREAHEYRFESHLNWNKKCCEREPAETPKPQPTEYFAVLPEKLIEEIIVTGKRLKRNLKPLKIPFDEEWKLGGDLKYHFDEFEFDFDWKKFLKEEE